MTVGVPFSSDLVKDTTPQLGGNLDVNGNDIVSISNGDINIIPNGTGDVKLGNFTFDVDQSVGAGQDNYVLTYDHSTGKINLEVASGGDVVNDTTPQLGGDLDVNGNDIVSVSNANINILPNGSGNVILGNYHFDTDQSLSGSNEGHLLTYNNVFGFFSAVELTIVSDTSPQLGGDLDVNGNDIISSSDGDIKILPNGTGNIGVGDSSPSSTLSIFTPAISSAREKILEATTGESTYSKFGVGNFTSTDSIFIPMFYGFNNDDDRAGLSFLGLVDQDVATDDIGAIDFNVGNIPNNSSDPINATRTALNNHNILSIRNDGDQVITVDEDGQLGLETTNPAERLHVNGAIAITERSSDPSDPAEGQAKLWMSDGTGSGDDGDIMMKIRAGGTTKTITLVDFSAA